jgi:hypothetical protein
MELFTHLWAGLQNLIGIRPVLVVVAGVIVGILGGAMPGIAFQKRLERQMDAVEVQLAHLVRHLVERHAERPAANAQPSALVVRTTSAAPRQTCRRHHAHKTPPSQVNHR